MRLGSEATAGNATPGIAYTYLYTLVHAGRLVKPPAAEARRLRSRGQVGYIQWAVYTRMCTPSSVIGPRG
jgi:hypothetical protein